MDPNYQQPPYGGQPGYGMPPVKKGNGLAVASLVCGLVGLLLFGVILGPLAIIFGAIGLGHANKNEGVGKGLAIAGLILGCLDLMFFFVVIAMLSH